MLIYIVFFGLGVALINAENKERKASLLVLPPLVLGYEELYADAVAKAPDNSAADQTRQNQNARPPLRNTHSTEREHLDNTDDKIKVNVTNGDGEFVDEYSDDFTNEMAIEVNTVTDGRKGDVVEKIQRRSKRSAAETPCPCQRG